MTSRLLRLLVGLALVAAVPVLTGAGNDTSDAARAEHQRIVEFWTPERVAQAIPRDFVFDPGTGRFAPAGKPEGTPGGGNGNGGNGSGGGDTGGSGLITGESWNGGGQVDGAVGKVLFELGGTYYICSATVIDDGSAGTNGTALILTAAHCVYDEGSNGTVDGFSQNWTFIPDYDDAPAPLSVSDDSYCDATRFGCWTAEAMVVHDGYASAGGFNATAIRYDFAVVRVGLGGNANSPSPELDAAVDEQGFSFADLGASASGHAFGYPAEKKWKGNDLIYCSGPIDGDPYQGETTYRMNGCKLNGGSSGGGWMSPFDDAGFGTLVSVNSYGYRGIDAMHGPKLNDHTKAVYEAAQTGPTGIVGG